MTATIVADGPRRGAEFAFLHASASGFGVYQCIGFGTVEDWHLRFAAPE